MLRAVRFAARYECRIEPATWTAIREMAHTIRRISAERIRDELEKSFRCPQRPQAIRLMADAGLLPHLWEGAVWSDEHVQWAARVVEHLPAEAGFEQTFAILMLDRPAAEVDRICRALTCSNRTREHITWLVRNKDVCAVPSRLTPADLKLLMQSPHFGDLLAQFAAVCRATGRPMTAYDEIAARAAAIPADEVRPPPFVDGNDLLAMHLTEGPAFRRILDRVYYAQLNGDVRERAGALKLAADLAAEAKPESASTAPPGNPT